MKITQPLINIKPNINADLRQSFFLNFVLGYFLKKKILFNRKWHDFPNSARTEKQSRQVT